MMRHLRPFFILILAALVVALLIDRFPGRGEAKSGLSAFDAATRPATRSLALLAVQDNGRLKTLESFAREKLAKIYGRERYGGLEPVLTVLSWAFCRTRWETVPIIKLPRAIDWKRTGRKAGALASHISPQQACRFAEMSAREAKGRAAQRGLSRLRLRLSLFENLPETIRLVPCRVGAQWHSLDEAADLGMTMIAQAARELEASLQTSDAKRYSDAARRLSEELVSRFEGRYPPVWLRHLEWFYARVQPFWLVSVAYLVLAILYAIRMVLKRAEILRLGRLLLWAVIALHLAALVARSLIANRIMATNSYEYILVMTLVTAIGSAWLQRRRAEPVYGLVGTILSGVALGATVLSPLSRSISPLVPALQSNWLRYHVGTAAAAYGLLYLSFGLSLAYLFTIKSGRNPALARSLLDANYQLIAAGFVLLGVGIITGAVWADEAWGRYWGWDPKESWSLVTLLIYGIFLHLRFVVVGRRRGILLSSVSIVGFLAVLFTFIGVNYVLSGLHSYS